MAAIRPDHSSGSSSHEKKGYAEEPQEYPTEIHNGEDLEDEEHSLHRGLKARQITMIAIGGAIGTGLIVGT